MPEFPDPTDQNVLAADCQRCSALADSRTRISWGNGPRDADLVVVGEAPAAGDPGADRWQGGNHTGLAYTSRRSGRKVRRLVADLDYGDAYYTNAVNCFPADTTDSGATTDSTSRSGDHELPDNREPTAEERANCRPYLVTEIREVTPKAVLGTGKHATQSVLRSGGALSMVASSRLSSNLTLPELETTLVPVFHPSYEEIWRARLGYDRRADYVAAVRAALP